MVQLEIPTKWSPEFRPPARSSHRRRHRQQHALVTAHLLTRASARGANFMIGN